MAIVVPLIVRETIRLEPVSTGAPWTQLAFASAATAVAWTSSPGSVIRVPPTMAASAVTAWSRAAAISGVIVVLAEAAFSVIKGAAGPAGMAMSWTPVASPAHCALSGVTRSGKPFASTGSARCVPSSGASSTYAALARQVQTGSVVSAPAVGTSAANAPSAASMINLALDVVVLRMVSPFRGLPMRTALVAVILFDRPRANPTPWRLAPNDRRAMQHGSHHDRSTTRWMRRASIVMFGLPPTSSWTGNWRAPAHHRTRQTS